MPNQELSHSERTNPQGKKSSTIDMGVNLSTGVQSNTCLWVISNESLISEEGDENKAIVSVAGRVMARRIMGKAAFSISKTIKVAFKYTFDGMM